MVWMFYTERDNNVTSEVFHLISQHKSEPSEIKLYVTFSYK